MKENLELKLYDVIEGATAFGNTEGREVYQKLLTKLDADPTNNIVGISLEGVTRTDASFPRESVVSLAKSRCGEKGFYLQDFESRDLMDNWDYAAKAKSFSLIVISPSGYELIGDEINAGARDLLDLVMTDGAVTTSKVADFFQVSAQNASAKLKKLHSLGLVLGSKQAAESGGIEFVYTAIKPI